MALHCKHQPHCSCQPQPQPQPQPHQRLQELEYPLHLAVAGGQAGAVAILLDNGALVDAIDGKRCTPLHAAAALGHADIAALLLASGAHPGLYDAQRRTAMAIAEAAGHTTVADVIERAFGASCGAQWGVRPHMVRPMHHLLPPYAPMQCLSRAHWGVARCWSTAWLTCTPTWTAPPAWWSAPSVSLRCYHHPCRSTWRRTACWARCRARCCAVR